MRKRYVVAAVFTGDGEDRFLAYVKQKQFAWWHHIPNFWLLTSANANCPTANDVRDAIKQFSTSGPSLIMDFPEENTWSGTFPISEPDTFKWLGGSWSREEN